MVTKVRSISIQLLIVKCSAWVLEDIWLGKKVAKAFRQLSAFIHSKKYIWNAKPI